jgi:HEAT repeat protein
MNAQSQKFLAEIQDKNADVRYSAWIRTGEMDPEVIPELGKLVGTAEPGVRRAAEEALKNMVHSVGKNPAAPKRPAVVQQFLVLTVDKNPTWTRTIALRHLSLIGGDEIVPMASKLLWDANVREEAVFCLERIPGTAATVALMAALPDADSVFQQRLLAALGHRRDEEATDVCARFITSKNPDLAIAGMKAVARIGKRPSMEIKTPDQATLSAWQKVEYSDSVLRYADEQVRRGNTKHPIETYQNMLKQPQEHLQCAAIVSLGKMKSPEAAALVSGMMKSENNTVRITATKVYAAMSQKG